MWDHYGTLYEPQSWIDNGGPIAGQAAAAIDPSDAPGTDSNQNAEDGSPGPSATTIITATGDDGSTTTSMYVDTKVYPGAYPTGTDGLRSLEYTSTVVNHGFSSSIRPQPSVSGNASVTHNGTKSGEERVFAVRGSRRGLAASLLGLVVSIMGGSYVLI
jgi:hypothetical protein